MFDEDFVGRIVPFDTEAARPYAEIAAERHHRGRSISQFDAQDCGYRTINGSNTRNAQRRRLRPLRNQRRQSLGLKAATDALPAFC